MKDQEQKSPSLLQEHRWRLGVIVGLTALPAHQLLIYDSTHELIGYAGALLLCLYFLQTEVSFMQQRKQLPPGALGGTPFLGEFVHMFTNPYDNAVKNKRKYGSTYTSYALGSLSIVMGEPGGISWLWNAERKGQAKASWPPTISTLLGKGAVANQFGLKHKALRRILEPAFAPTAIRDYVTILDNTVQQDLKQWAKADCFHSSSVFKLFALRLFFMSAFGHVKDNILKSIHDDFFLWANGFGFPLPLRIPGTSFAKAMDARDRILATVEQLIHDFKRENPPDSERGQRSMMGRICYGKDEAGKPMDIEDLKDNILNMVFAGHDTTYASMGTALKYLSKYPATKDAIAGEVRNFQEPLDFDELKNAPLLNAFLAEIWRMDPPVPGGFRTLTKTVDFNGHQVSAGSIVRYSTILGSQNEEVYPDPTEFRIARFLPEDHPFVSTDKENDAFRAIGVDYNNMKANYPIFGGGTHGCLGSHFAKLEMRVMLTRLLQAYELEVQNVEKVAFPFNGWKNEFRLTKL